MIDRAGTGARRQNSAEVAAVEITGYRVQLVADVDIVLSDELRYGVLVILKMLCLIQTVLNVQSGQGLYLPVQIFKDNLATHAIPPKFGMLDWP